MKFPNESSTVEEIEGFSPRSWAGAMFWHNEKRRLLKLKKMEQYWKNL